MRIISFFLLTATNYNHHHHKRAIAANSEHSAPTFEHERMTSKSRQKKREKYQYFNMLIENDTSQAQYSQHQRRPVSSNAQHTAARILESKIFHPI